MDDLISRAAMIEALGHFNDYVNEDIHFLNGIETAKEIAVNLPAVDAIPVEWLRGWQDEVGTINEWWPIIERIITVWHEEQEAR